MNKLDKLKGHTEIIILLAVSFIIRAISLFTQHDLWWDSSVYIGMGKYIFSLGDIGLWEASRPLVWPVILGFFWKIGLDPVFFGKIISSFFSLASIILLYIIILKIFNKKIAVFAALFFSFSQTFLYFNNILFSDIPSTFFLLLGIYFLFENKHIPSGLFLGIAFMARFFQIFLIVPAIIFYLFLFYKKKISFKESLIFLGALAIPAILFFILNFIIYKNPFYPFILQIYMTKNTGWVFHQPFGFYFANIIKENFFAVFSILGAIFIIKQREYKAWLVLALFLFPFVLYLSEQHKEMRLLIPILPFLYTVAAVGLVRSAEYLKKYKNVALSLVVVLWLLQTTPLLQFDKYDDQLDPFYDYINSTKISKGIWISNPSFIVFSEKKADELVYYPLYYSQKAKQLQKKVNEAMAVLINTCDITPCPNYDYQCTEETSALLELFGSNMEKKLYQQKGICSYYIFES